MKHGSTLEDRTDMAEQVEVELDALPPDELRGLFSGAMAEFWNASAHQVALDREHADRQTLEARTR